MCKDHPQGHGNCRCAGMPIGRFLQPCFLLLLHMRSAHGYELIQRLEEFGFSHEEMDPGTVYRQLRRMEEEGLVMSKWDTEQGGPAKRLYEITDEGEEILHAWAVTLEKHKQRIEGFINTYNHQFKEGQE